MSTGAQLELITRELVAEIYSLSSARDFRAFLRHHRDIDGDLLWRTVQGLQAPIQLGPGPLEAVVTLIKDGQAGDAGLAWDKFRRSRARFTQSQPAAMAMIEQLRQQLEAEAFDDVLTGVGVVKSTLAEHGHIGALMLALSFEGQAAFKTQTGSRAQNLERAGASFQEALRIARSFDDPGVINDLINKLAGVLAERIRGDSVDDLASAERLMREAIHTLPAQAPDLIAMRKTNLATVLLRQNDSERNAAAVQEAIELCHDALALRPREHDPDGWAYTQLVLGDALQELSGSARPEHLDEVVQIFEAVTASAHEIIDRTLVAGAFLRLGVITSAMRSGQRESLPSDIGGRDAIRMFHSALALAEGDHVLTGRVILELGTAYERLGLHDLAAEAMARSLNFLQPTNSPNNCARATGFLGDYHATRGEWQECARYSILAVQVAELKIHSQMNLSTRHAEMKRAGNTYRWAAFALARAGDAVTAAVVLEQGRARELRSRLPPRSSEASLEQLPAPLRERYEAALTELRRSPFGQAGRSAVRAMMEATNAIRSLQGHGEFGMILTAEDIIAGAEPGWPLVFVNPSPWGTLLLSVSREQGVGRFEAEFIEEVKSGAVAAMLLVGVTDPDGYDGSSDVGSYVLSVGSPSVGDDSRFRSTLEQTLQWLGQNICRQLPKLNALSHGGGVTLVVSGLLGMVPLHAAQWLERGAPTSLLDSMPVRYAASASMCANAIEQSKRFQGVSPRLAALLNPTGDLPASEAEVEAIVRAFGAEASVVASQEAATSTFLATEGSVATHVHLACHAGAATMGSVAAVVELSDGPLALGSSPNAIRLNARLTVMSACQTGLWNLTDVGDEMLSMAAAVHALGSACVVATLWQVNSYATALLMSRFYDELLQEVHPAEALRRAQIWMRNLDGGGLLDFLDRHPLLSDALDRRGTPPTRALAGSRDAHSSELLFEHPDFWGAFVALGA